MVQFLALALCLLPLAAAAPQVERRSTPTVTLKSGGTISGSQSNGVDSFSAIPFAKPPVGQLRLKPPQSASPLTGNFAATSTPLACPQFLTQIQEGSLPAPVASLLNSATAKAATDGEDCLTLNVQRPSTANATSNLPVLFWIYGGGFEFGSTTNNDGAKIVSASHTQHKDIIYVQANYRLGGFGFLPGKEILKDGSANLGLLDQRLALQWVADNIKAFGGDPKRVTIWGESAGAISVWDQMALYNGNNTYKGQKLFHGAIMDSGSITPANPVDCPRAQVVYNAVVAAAGCSSAKDTLACLRTVDYATYKAAANSVPGIFGYNGIALSYLPRPDGKVLTASPDILAQQSKYTKIPFIIGDQEDEGTLFSLAQNNISTTSQLVDYLSNVVFLSANRSTVQGLVDIYPDDASAGSPFQTGPLYNIYPQYKRLAAMQGDFVFTLTRRAWLQVAAKNCKSKPNWSYLATNLRGTPVLGTFHSSDLLYAYGEVPGMTADAFMAYYLSFVNTLDPNNGTASGYQAWPRWSDGNRLLEFAASGEDLIDDTFRATAANYLVAHTPEFRV